MRSPEQIAREAMRAFTLVEADPFEDDEARDVEEVSAAYICEQIRDAIRTDRSQRPDHSVLFVPSAGIRVAVGQPSEVYEALTTLIDTGYTFDEIEWGLAREDSTPACPDVIDAQDWMQPRWRVLSLDPAQPHPDRS